MLDYPHKNHSINLQETFMVICMQEISFITHFFLKILQRISKLVILGIWACLATPKVILSIWRNLWCLSESKKPTSFFPFSLRYCKDIANLLFWVLWESLLTHTQNDISNLKKTFVFICKQNNNFIHHVFLEILHWYANFLFWVL